jgi:hypothetical protein
MLISVLLLQVPLTRPWLPQTGFGMDGRFTLLSLHLAETDITKQWLHKPQVCCRCFSSFFMLISVFLAKTDVTKFWLIKSSFVADVIVLTSYFFIFLLWR